MHMHVIFANNPLQYLYILHITYLDDQTLTAMESEAGAVSRR